MKRRLLVVIGIGFVVGAALALRRYDVTDILTARAIRLAIGWSVVLSVLSVIPLMTWMYRRLVCKADTDAAAFTATIGALEKRLEESDREMRTRQSTAETLIKNQWGAIALEIGALKTTMGELQIGMDRLIEQIKPAARG